MAIRTGITIITADNAVKSKKNDTEITESIIKVKRGNTGLRHDSEYLIFLYVDPLAITGNETKLKSIPTKIPHPIAIQEFVVSMNV